MKEEDYKKDTPTAYFTGKFTPRPAGQTDDDLKEKEEAEIVKEGAKMAIESAHSHKVPLHEEPASLVQKYRVHNRHHKEHLAHHRQQFSHHREQMSHHKKQHHHIQSLVSKPDYRISAWTDDQHDVSHPKEWDEETQRQAKGYIQSLHQKTPSK